MPGRSSATAAIAHSPSARANSVTVDPSSATARSALRVRFSAHGAERTPNRPRGTDEYRATRRRWGPPAGIRARGNTTMRMRTAIAAGVATGATALVLGAVALTASGPPKAVASSHREAPLIANDPTADLPDFYLFPSPDAPGTVTMIANVIPLEAPPEGPNYYNLDDSARYRFNIDWNGDGKADRTWTMRTSACARPGRCGARRAMARVSRWAPASPHPTTSARTPSPAGTTRCASRPSRRSATARRSSSARVRTRSQSTSAGSST